MLKTDDGIEIYNNITDTTFSAKGSKKYPYILLPLIEGIHIVLDGLEEGDLPLIVSYEGRLKALPKSCKKHPYTLKKLIDICPIDIVFAENDIRHIETIKDLLDMEDFKWTS